MNTRLPAAAMLLLPTLVAAQGLTNAQVHDFEIGDVFQTTDYWCADGCSSCPPFLYVRDSVIDKQFGVGGYEVLYTFDQQRYRAPGGPFQAEDTMLTYDWGYVDGAAYPAHYVESGGGVNCFDPYILYIDTVQTNSQFCGRMHWWAYYHPCDTCFCFGPPSPWSSFFVAGCGGPYYADGADFPTDVCFGRSLSYYNKGGLECGNEIAMGLSPVASVGAFMVFPNPVDDVLNWSTGPGPISVEIHAMEGTLVEQVLAVDRLDVRELAPGMYMLTMIRADGPSAQARFIKR